MVHLQGVESNALFEELKDWEAQLIHCDFYENDKEPSNQNDELTPQSIKNGGAS